MGTKYRLWICLEKETVDCDGDPSYEDVILPFGPTAIFTTEEAGMEAARAAWNLTNGFVGDYDPDEEN